MAQMEVGINGIVNRTLPAGSAELQEGKARLGRYREPFSLSLVPTKHLLADEGTYFVSSNQAPGTTVQLNANVTAFSNTNAIAHILNTDVATTGKRIHFDFLKLILAGTAPTATVSMEFAFVIDTINREPAAANRALITPVAVGEIATASIARASQYLNANAFTVIAPSSAARVVRAHVCTGLGITGDEYLVKCGGEDLGATPGATATRAAMPARLTGYAAPLSIGPGQSLTIHMWWLTAATTAATFELEMGHWER